jgi:hypothetical protein
MVEGHTELRLLRAYQFQGHVTASDASVGLGEGFTWMDRSLESCGSERIGREEEGMRSGRAELGVYTAILKRTPYINRELHRIHIYGCRCNERLKAKTEGSTRLAYTGLLKYQV